MTELKPTLPSPTDPDAAVWAKSFVEHFTDADEGLMLGWFANAMMAMHDHLVANGAINNLVAAIQPSGGGMK